MVSWTLKIVQLLMSVVMVAVVIKILYLQFFWKPTPNMVKYFGTSDKVDTLYPERGAIYDCKDRLIALSVPMYELSMDCTVRKTEFQDDRPAEQEWRQKAHALAAGLSRLAGTYSADEWYRKIIWNREHNNSYLRICAQADYDTMKAISSLPLFDEGQFKGGLVVKVTDTRKYPYGALGRRAIGLVENNRDRSRITGIEEKCNTELHGREGWAKLAYTDRRGVYVPVSGWKSRKAVNGSDVKSTLDMDIQDLADRALRDVMSTSDDIRYGCCIVMDVETGAIRGMANLKKDSENRMGEAYNYAISEAKNPGSVFKTATLMAALDDGLTTLSTRIPCDGVGKNNEVLNGRYYYKGAWTPFDKHVGRDRYPDGFISVEEGLKTSSNHVFRYLGGECYGKSKSDVRHYISRLESYGLFEDFDFDLNGLASAYVKDPNESGEALTLPMVAMGYDMATTPLHVLTFYNAIANGGREMKPYVIEAIMKDGEVEKRFEPQVLHSSICKKSTADSLTRALLKVTKEPGGTGYWRFRGSKCDVAGKTGTAFITFKNSAGKTVFNEGSIHVIQATFAGFFPAEDPKYSVICVINTRKTAENIEGARCASAARFISDALWGMNPQWEEGIRDRGRMAKVNREKLETDPRTACIPDVVGLGLSDAIYSLESCGYRYSYEGHGKVVSQSPAAGTQAAKKTQVSIKLK